jgi:hypothetical protein
MDADNAVGVSALRFLSFRKKPFADDELREALFDLAAGSKTRALAKLVAEHQGRIHTLFPSWKVLPLEIRSDPDKTRRWFEGMITIASAFAELGDGTLYALLQGNPEENVIVRWGEALTVAQAEVDRKNHTEAIRILEDALKYPDGLTGSAVDAYLPKHYGLLGHAYFLAGNRESARTFTIKARNYCERIKDHEGVAIYTSNLATIDSA